MLLLLIVSRYKIPPFRHSFSLSVCLISQLLSVCYHNNSSNVVINHSGLEVHLLMLLCYRLVISRLILFYVLTITLCLRGSYGWRAESPSLFVNVYITITTNWSGGLYNKYFVIFSMSHRVSFSFEQHF